ncbi:MAG: VOC family protein [Sphingomonadaceae bacterium]|nr:VOC family protein [Sphingomonadaceae bacterium]
MPITIVSIPVSDPQRSKAFYTDVMDFKLLRESPMGPEMSWIQLQPKDGGATITLVNWFDAMPPGGQQGLMLHVADIDAERERLLGLGVDVPPIEEQPWGRYVMVKDPDGNGWAVTTQTGGRLSGVDFTAR